MPRRCILIPLELVLLLLADGDVHGTADLKAQLGLHLIAAVGLDRLIQHNLLLGNIHAVLSFLQSKVSMAGNAAADSNDATARSTRMMMWMMPLMSLWIGFTLPAALGVYWIVNSLLYAIQEKVLTKYYKSHMEDEISEREKQKREERVRRMEAAREQQRKIAAEEAEKKTLKEKRAEKQANKSNKKKNSTNENGRVGDRPYARGRSYDPEHYGE